MLGERGCFLDFLTGPLARREVHAERVWRVVVATADGVLREGGLVVIVVQRRAYVGGARSKVVDKHATGKNKHPFANSNAVNMYKQPAFVSPTRLGRAPLV